MVEEKRDTGFDETPGFNMGVSTVQRISKLLDYSHEVRLTNDLNTWKGILDAVYIELHPFLDKHNAKFEEDFEELGSKISKIMGTEDPQAVNLIAPMLFGWEIKLRQGLKDTGLLMKEEEGVRFKNKR